MENKIPSSNMQDSEENATMNWGMRLKHITNKVRLMNMDLYLIGVSISLRILVLQSILIFISMRISASGTHQVQRQWRWCFILHFLTKTFQAGMSQVWRILIICLIMLFISIMIYAVGTTNYRLMPNTLPCLHIQPVQTILLVVH